MYKASSQVGFNQIWSLADGNHTVTLDYGTGIICDQIDLMLQCEAGYVPRSGGATITSVVLHGTGTNPFTLGSWCQAFDFAHSSDGNWVDWAYNGTHCQFVTGQGWVSGYRSAGNEDEARVSIRRNLAALATITQIQVTYEADFEEHDEEREQHNMFCKLYAANDLMSDETTFDVGDGVHTLTFNIEAATCNRIDLMLQCEAGYVPRQGGATITKVVIYGTGANPFTLDEDHHQSELDTKFATIRDALQTNPSADVSTAVGEYKTAIQNAFGVTFDKESGADDWADSNNVAALHFARQGLQAVAEAFQTWTERESCTAVDRFALFRRITGGLTLNNVATEASNVAITTGKTISINRVPSANRQWRMTPNNLIHEIGHSLSRAAGYDTVKLGSIEQALEGNSLISGFTRDGMGPDYLRDGITPGDYSTFFYIHATIDNGGNGVATFAKVDGAPDLSPENYLLYDLFGDKFDLWDSGYNHLGLNGRIDIFVQNWPAAGESDDIKLPEIVADAFLNWVQGSFEGTTGTAWQTFFDENVGRFMRNATIYWKGMSIHYIQNGILRSTQTDSRSFIEDQELGWSNLRLIPVAGDGDNLIGAAPISGRDPLSSKIYGWWQESISSDIWLLVDSQPTDGKRLAWVIGDGVAILSNDLVDAQPPAGNRILDYGVLNPGRAFSETDLCTLLGLLIEECSS